jgi:hypothetical protein
MALINGSEKPHDFIVNIPSAMQQIRRCANLVHGQYAPILGGDVCNV